MVIIGIAGPSSSGKSSLTKLLKKDLDATTLCLDSFFHHSDTPARVVLDGKEYDSFDNPKLYDAHRLYDVLQDLKKGNVTSYLGFTQRPGNLSMITVTPSEHIIVEGFLLFTYTTLKQEFDHTFFLDIPEDLMLERRRIRGDRRDDGFFQTVGIPEWRKYGAAQKNYFGITVLDGTKPLEENKEVILRCIK